jgi:hypothetical protein
MAHIRAAHASPRNAPMTASMTNAPPITTVIQLLMLNRRGFPDDIDALTPKVI